jgi:pyruvate,water dikinase
MSPALSTSVRFPFALTTFVFVVTALTACTASDSPQAEDPPPSDDPYLTSIRSADELASLTESGGTSGGSVKYLAPEEGRPAFEPLTERCYFQNMKRYSWHLDFLQSFPGREGISYEAYTSIVLRKASRRLWGGSVKPWSRTLHPLTKTRGVISYSVYAESGSLDVASVTEVDRTLKACMPYAEDLLVYVPESPDQEAFLARNGGALADAGVAAVRPSDLQSGDETVVYSHGEGYGTLHVVPRGEPLDEYGPRDVVVVESVPNDISIVAGLISQNPQNELGHVNLRLREKGIPNVSARAVYDAAFVNDLAGRLVHLVVTDDAYEVTEATLEDAQAYWDAHRPGVTPISGDLTVTALAPFDELRATDKTAYGAKAANLGELTRVLDRPQRNDGFGVPFSAYVDFMKSTALDADVSALVADPEVRTRLGVKRSRLDELQDGIEHAPFPPALLQRLEETIVHVYGEAGRMQMLRFRSSTNVEDLDTFTGAGLYDSKSGCLADDLDGDTAGPSLCLSAEGKAFLERELERRKQQLDEHLDWTWLLPIIEDIEGDLSEEKPISRTVRKVWASLWNERAFDEREYYGMDHLRSYMGIAVNPTFVVEKASAVAISNLSVPGGDEGAALYRLNSQAGSESVVRPEDPTAVAELLTFRRAGDPPAVTDVDIQVRSTLVPDGTNVWPDDKLDELGRLLFRVHDHFATQVYPELAPLHLDFEVKHDALGNVVIKQVRPYTSNL